MVMQFHKTIAIAAKGFNPNSLSERYTPLAGALGGLGCRTVVLNGAEDHLGDGVFSRYGNFTGSGIDMQSEPISIDAARDLTGGVARHTPVPALNPQSLRNAVMSKRFQSEILSPVLEDKLPESYFVIPDLAAVSSAIHATGGNRVVLKPEKGRASSKVLIGTKEELADMLPAYLSSYKASDGLVVVQAYLESVDASFGPSLKPLTDQDAAIIGAGGKQEIRVHVIDENPILVHGKVAPVDAQTQADNTYVFFDPETVDDGIKASAVRVARALRERTESNDSYLAVDMTPDGSFVTEVNGRNQGAITSGMSTSPEPHKAWLSGLSTKLAAMAEPKDVEKKGTQ